MSWRFKSNDVSQCNVFPSNLKTNVVSQCNVLPSKQHRPLQCYAAIQKSVDDGEELRTMGCFADKYRSKLMCKMAAAPTVAVLCCDTEFCNLRLQPQYAPPPAIRQPGECRQGLCNFLMVSLMVRARALSRVKILPVTRFGGHMDVNC